MEYAQFLDNMYQNRKLNEDGLNDYIQLLKQEIISLKQKVMDLEYELQYKPPRPKI